MTQNDRTETQSGIIKAQKNIKWCKIFAPLNVPLNRNEDEIRGTKGHKCSCQNGVKDAKGCKYSSMKWCNIAEKWYQEVQRDKTEMQSGSSELQTEIGTKV